jgi:thiol-disulfide isomerase/thioredoxin
MSAAPPLFTKRRREIPLIEQVYNRAVAALEPGTPFPSIPLTDAKGASFAPTPGNTLYVVFKTTCPTCELTWPYLERLRQTTEPSGLRIVAVSQDDPRKTSAYNARLGSRVETAFDREPWPASDRLGVTNVPTFFRVNPDGSIAETVVGFARDRMEGFARSAAEAAGKPYTKLFRAGDSAPASKPG